MHVNLADLGTICTLLGLLATFIGWAVKSSIINPLNRSIISLQATIETFRKAIDSLEENQHRTDRKMAVMAEKQEVASQRITSLENELHEMKNQVQYKAY